MSTNKPALILMVQDHYRDVGEHKAKELLVDTDSVTIGRGRDCDIFIASETVSTKHARVFYDPDQNCWMIEDLGSNNGIIYKDNKISKQVLQDEDEFFLGESLLTIKLHSLNLDKTRDFSILTQRKKKWDYKRPLLMTLLLLLITFLNIQTSYFTTQKELYSNIVAFLTLFIFANFLTMLFSWISQRKFNLVKLFVFNFYALMGSIGYELLEKIFLSATFLWVNELVVYLMILLYTAYLGKIISKQKNHRAIWLRSVSFTFLIFVMKFISSLNSGTTYMKVPYLVSFSNGPKTEKTLQQLDEKMDKMFVKVQEELKEINENKEN